MSPQHGVDDRRTITVLVPMERDARPCWPRAHVVAAEDIHGVTRAELDEPVSWTLVSELDAWLAEMSPLVVWRAPDLEVTSSIGESETDFVARVARLRQDYDSRRLVRIKARYHAKQSALVAKQRSAAARVEHDATAVANIEQQLAVLHAQLADDIAAIRGAPPPDLVRAQISHCDADIRFSVLTWFSA